jgi:hypothetical protein
MQESLVFSPTLQVQHFRLAHALRNLRGLGGLPSNYASHQIETFQFKQAIETVERGRALLWSEMRGLRTSADQVRAADPASAEKLGDINRRLELVTMFAAQIESEEMGDSETGTGTGGTRGWTRLVVLLPPNGDFWRRGLLESLNYITHGLRVSSI